MSLENVKETDPMLRQLERILDTCVNIRHNINTILAKDLNSPEIIENINFVSGNLNSVLKACESSFKYYLTVPNSTKSDESKI